MTRSAYATTSPLTVDCPRCHARPGMKCFGRERSHSERVKAADDKRTAEVQGQTKPFFTPPAEPIPPEYYHSVVGSDGIFMTPIEPKNAEAFGQWLRDAENKVTKAVLGTTPDYRVEIDPPPYLPMREPLSPRVPDLNPDEQRDEHHASCDCGFCPIRTQWSAEELAPHDAEKAIDEANWLAQSDAEIAASIVPVDDGPDISFNRPAPAHNLETCRNPACECFPF